MPDESTPLHDDDTTLRLPGAAPPATGLAAGRAATGTSAVTHREEAGSQVDRYWLIELLGEGGFGAVWRAEQLEPIHREVAVKVVKPGMDSAEIVARFAAERQALALMDHPNIAAVLDAGETKSGRPFFVMELVRGIPITAYCDEMKLTLRQRLELFIPVCLAIQHAHQKAILHRDLKPSNILVEEQDGRAVPKVIDFGIAKALGSGVAPQLDATLARTLAGMIIGTPQYMSPEQAGSCPDVDTRSDIYMLGAILYELLTGRPPLSREGLQRAGIDEILRRVREEEIKRPSSCLVAAHQATQTIAESRRTTVRRLEESMKGDLDWILLKALDKDRTRRYDSANALADDLQRFLNHEPVAASRPGRAYRFVKFIQRNKGPVAAAAAIMASLIAGVIVSAWQAARARRAEAEALTEQGIAQSETARAQKSEAAATEKTREASRSDYATAQQHLEKGEWSAWVAYLGRALRYDQENLNARDALWNALVYGFPDAGKLPVGPDIVRKGPITDVEFSHDGTRVVIASMDGTATIHDANSGQTLGETLRHSDFVLRAVFSPDDTRVLTASSDGTARLWDGKSGTPLGSPMEHQKLVESAEFSPDGALVLTVSRDKTAQVWDAKSGRPLGKSMTHGATTRSAAFSPDSAQVVTTHWDKSIRFWDAKSGEPLGHPIQHGKVVDYAGFNSDGTHIVTLSDGVAQLWDAKTGQLFEPEPVPGSSPQARVPSPDGTRVFSSSEDTATRHFDVVGWKSGGKYFGDARTGKFLGHVRSPDDSIHPRAFSPDGTRMIISGGDNTTRFFDVRTGQLLGPPMQHSAYVMRAEFSRDGTRLLTTCRDDTVRIWDVRTSRPIGGSMWHGPDLLHARFSPNGTRVITAGGQMGAEGRARFWEVGGVRPIARLITSHGGHNALSFDSSGQRVLAIGMVSVRMVDVDTGQPVWPEIPHEPGVESAALNRQGTRIVSLDSLGKARLWDAENGQLVRELMPAGQARGLTGFSPDGSLALTVNDRVTVRLWDAQTGEERGKPLVHTNHIMSADFSPDSKLLVTADSGMTRIWDIETGRTRGTPLPRRIEGVGCEPRFSPDSSSLITASMPPPSAAYLWDTKNARLRGTPLQHDFPEAFWISDAQFSPDGTLIVTAGLDDTARVWSASATRPAIAVLRHTSDVHTAIFSPDSTRIVTASEDTTARIWDAHTGRAIGASLRHTAAVRTARFSAGGRQVVTASDDKTVRIWDALTGRPLGIPLTHGEEVRDAVFSPDGTHVTSTGPENGGVKNVFLWRVAPGQPIDGTLAEDLATICGGSRLSPEFGTLIPVSPEARLELLQRLRETMARPELSRWNFALKFHLPGADIYAPGLHSTGRSFHDLATSLIHVGTADSLREAGGIDPGHPLLPFAHAVLDAHESSAELAKQNRSAAEVLSARAKFVAKIGMTRLPEIEAGSWTISAARMMLEAGLKEPAVELAKKAIADARPDARSSRAVQRLVADLVKDWPDLKETLSVPPAAPER